MRRRRHVPAPLTSMIDVVFILVFAALAGRSSASPEQAQREQPTEQEATSSAATATMDAGAGSNASASDAAVRQTPIDSFAQARDKGRREAARSLTNLPVVAVRVSADGTVTAIEEQGQRHNIAVPLLERVSDPDVGLAYLGDRSAELQVCAIARRSIELDGHLVVIATEADLASLRVALVAGLRRDVERCRQHGAFAVLVDRKEQAPEVSP